MTMMKLIGTAAAILTFSLASASAGSFTKGTVKKLDENAGKVTIIHEALVNLDMPAMTMVFRADKALIARMKDGQDIEFVADRVAGKLTVTELK